MKIVSFIMIFIVSLFMGCTTQGERMNELKHAIREIIDKSEGTIAVAYKDIITGNQMLINDKRVMHAASTMKVPVMIEVFKQSQQGKFSMNDSVKIINRFHSIVDSSIYSMELEDDDKDIAEQRIGKTMPVYDLVFQMITVSSNLATNILIEMVKPENVMKTMHEIGAKTIQVIRGVQDIKAFEAGMSNITDAYDLMVIMQAIAEKSIITPSACDSMIDILSSQKYSDKIPGLLPPDVKVANKTGHITAIDHDAAIVYLEPDHPYVLVVLTDGIYDHKKAARTIAQISRVVYDSYF